MGKSTQKIKPYRPLPHPLTQVHMPKFMGWRMKSHLSTGYTWPFRGVQISPLHNYHGLAPQPAFTLCFSSANGFVLLWTSTALYAFALIPPIEASFTCFLTRQTPSCPLWRFPTLWSRLVWSICVFWPSFLHSSYRIACFDVCHFQPHSELWASRRKVRLSISLNPNILSAIQPGP